MFYYTYLGTFLKSAVLISWLALPFTVEAASTNLPAHGGVGGNAFSLDCGLDKVLVGVYTRSGISIEQLRGKCVKVTTLGLWINEVSSSPSVGRYSGGSLLTGWPQTNLSVTCPKNTMVIGISGTLTTNNIQQISLQCSMYPNMYAAIPAAYLQRPSYLFAGSALAGSQSFVLETCPNNGVGRGFHGKVRDGVSTTISQLGLICHSGNTPQKQITNGTEPINLAASNLVDPQVGPTTNQATPYVQIRWTDNSSLESGYDVVIESLTTPSFFRVFNRPAASGIGSVQALTVTDLPSGNYRASVVMKLNTDLYFDNAGPYYNFTIAGSSNSGASSCRPAINSMERIGSGTARVSWSHNCNNPSYFAIKAGPSENSMRTVAWTVDGTVRQDTFNFGVDSMRVKVCAVYPSTEACSTSRFW